MHDLSVKLAQTLSKNPSRERLASRSEFVNANGLPVLCQIAHALACGSSEARRDLAQALSNVNAKSIIPSHTSEAHHA